MFPNYQYHRRFLSFSRQWFGFNLKVIGKFHVEIRRKAIYKTIETIDCYTQIVSSLYTCQSKFSSTLERKRNSDLLT